MSETPTHSDFSSAGEDADQSFPSFIGRREYSNSSINNNNNNNIRNSGNNTVSSDISNFGYNEDQEAQTRLLLSQDKPVPPHHYSTEDSSSVSSETQPVVVATEANSQSGGYGLFVGYCFTVNYILGVGVLGIPHAFYLGGLIMGPLILLCLTVIAAIALSWVLETMARAEGMAQNAPQFKVTDERKFEVNELCRMFLGRYGGAIYEFFVAIYLYGALWSYSSVFAESMAAHIPLPVGPKDGLWFTCNVYTDHTGNCTAMYLIYIALFAIIVIPMTCLDLREQKPVQVVMALFRFFAMGLMVIVIFISIFVDPYSSMQSPTPKHAPYIAHTGLFDFRGFAPVFPVLVYSQIMHHSAPGLSEPVTKKKKLSRMFNSVFGTTFVMYTLLGLVMVLYYGNNISPTCSLNFKDYRGGAAPGEKVPVWAEIIIYIIILFPAIDVCSAFPLNGVTLGNNLMAALIKNPETRAKRWVRILFRLIAAIPPIIGASIVRELDTILKYVGLSGFVIAFIFPALLNIASSKKCREKFEQFKTIYSTYFTHPLLVTL